jgi:hypothetical protein
MNLPNALCNSSTSSKIHSSGKTKINDLARMRENLRRTILNTVAEYTLQTVPITLGEINNVIARIREEHTQSSSDSSALD